MATLTGVEMRSSRDTYGIKTLRPGRVKYVPGKTRDQFRRALAKYYKTHSDVSRKMFEWGDDTGGLIVRRVM